MIDSSDAHLEEAQGSSETISIPLVTQEAENMASQNEEQKVNEEQENGDDFVNKGLLQWEESREKWLGKCDSSSSTAAKAAVAIDVDEIIDLIFSQRWRSPEEDKSSFPQAVPLPQMVDILVDLWEAEGLDI